MNPKEIVLSDVPGQFVTHTITRNLDTALRRLRRQECTRRLWVDALCINQSDDKERAHQVSMMDQIYACANQAVIYLGEVEQLAFPSPRKELTSHEVDQASIALNFDASDTPMLERFRAESGRLRIKGSKGLEKTRSANPAADLFCLIRLLG